MRSVTVDIPLLDWTAADVLLGDLYSKAARQYTEVGNGSVAHEMREKADACYVRAERIAERYSLVTP
jgi:hypothetical protein